jgi:hypothetical protein
LSCRSAGRPARRSQTRSEQDEKLVLDYLRAYPECFVSATEVARKAGGRQRFVEDPQWASRTLLNLLARRLVQMNESGHYRIAVEK